MRDETNNPSPATSDTPIPTDPASQPDMIPSGFITIQRSDESLPAVTQTSHGHAQGNTTGQTAPSGTGRRGKGTGARPGVRKRRRLLATLLACVLVAAVAAWQLLPRFLAGKEEIVQAQRLATVTRGDLTVSITGSAPLAPVGKQTVSAEIETTVLEILAKNGDIVKTGDILMQLDTTDAERALEEAEANLTDAAGTADTTNENLASLMVRAPFDGLVTAVNAKEGDEVSGNNILLTLTDTAHLKLTVPFGASDRDALVVGGTATLTFSSLDGTVEGTITHVGGNNYRTADGSLAVDVEITMDNPGALAEGMSATVGLASDGIAITALESGTLEYADVRELKSDAGGTVTSLTVRKNQAVTKGTLLVVLENDTLAKSATSSQTRIESLTNKVADAQAVLDGCTVKAPGDGIVTGLQSTVGASVKLGTALCSILDVSTMTMEISIDELDIASVSEGQEVTATVDAVADTASTPITGTVDSIAVEGTYSNGVTTFPVTLSLKPDERLKSGMNADASILVTNKPDVLLVPIEAVTTINGKRFVYVTSDSASARNTTGAGIGFPGGAPPEGFDPANAPEGFAPPVGDNAAPGATSGTTSGTGTTNRQGRTRPGGTGSGATATGTSGGTGGSAWSRGTGSGTSGSGKTGSGTNATGTRQAARTGTSTTSGYYAGTTLVAVETGAHNETYMEILNGLSEGDQIVLPALTTASSSAQSSASPSAGMGIMGGVSGMGGAMGGGAPPDMGGGGNFRQN